MRNEYSLSDIAAATNGSNGFGDGNGAWWIILFLIFGWGRNGFGGGFGMTDGGLLGYAPIMPISKLKPDVFINRGGQIPSPLNSLKN